MSQIRYYYHLGSAARVAEMLVRGWRLVDEGTEPVSPCIDADWWLVLGDGCPAPTRAMGREEVTP